MAAKLNRRLFREVRVSTVRRPMIVGLDPETQTISLREKAGRRTYTLPILALYILAVKGKV